MEKNFSKLQLNKKTIAKLNDEQLTAIKGGNNVIRQDEECKITCKSTGVTNVQTAA